MDRKTWWKNFALNSELDISGAFIYNGLRTLHSLSNFHSETASFEILYNLSVGIERLQKVAVILLEADQWNDMQALEDSLAGHSTHALADRIEENHPQELAPIHKEFLNLLSDFYKNHRYSRFSLDSAETMGNEHEAFIEFLIKHLPIEPPEVPQLRPLQNSDQVRRFMGRVMKQIVRPLYDIVRNRAREMNIFTYEVSPGSKAGKIFLQDRLDFVDEDSVRREIFLHLLDTETDSDHVEHIRELPTLDLDSGLDVEFIAYLLDETPQKSSQVRGDVEVAFETIDAVGERLRMLDLLDQRVYWEIPSTDLLPFFQEEFGEWLDPDIVGIKVVQEPGACVLQVTRQADANGPQTTNRTRIPLHGLAQPETPTTEALEENEGMLRDCDAYDWVMISDVFHPDAEAKIAEEWEQASGESL